jgi:hypothetical protein
VITGLAVRFERAGLFFFDTSKDFIGNRLGYAEFL